MRIVALSDTHGLHKKFEIPEGDILIHAGDFTRYGDSNDLRLFAEWAEALPHKTKIVIAGNHDRVCEDDPVIVLDYFANRNINYLCDNMLKIGGIKFYGSPWIPTFFDWHFMANRGQEIADKWKMIPSDTDILVTHGPPARIFDIVRGGFSVGCADLMNRVRKVQPKYHIFGHVHEHYGGVIRLERDPDLKNTTFINCSVLDQHYWPVAKPVVFDI